MLWEVDRDDDEAEQIEERNWWLEEKRQEGTVRGNIKEFVIVVGMTSFFDRQISGTFLA